MSVPPTPEYRYIVRIPDVQGGRPVVKSTRIPVKTIVGYYRMGLSVEEILEGLPGLTPAQASEVLTYYHDHTAEVEQDIEAGRVERLIERYGLTVTADGCLVAAESNRGS